VVKAFEESEFKDPGAGLPHALVILSTNFDKAYDDKLANDAKDLFPDH
jgi:hypothetical protein